MTDARSNFIILQNIPFLELRLIVEIIRGQTDANKIVKCKKQSCVSTKGAFLVVWGGVHGLAHT